MSILKKQKISRFIPFPRKVMVQAVSALMLATPFSVSAQEEGALMEEVEVTGMRGSLKAALDTKRFANASVEAISAEDMGKFPDRNIAESLQRIPGVSISRSFAGEGGSVSIRGTNPELTQTLLNGQFVASTGWFSQGSSNRSFNMDLMPPEMVAGVEVYKSPVASQDEGGVGGTVVVKTRKPLDLDPWTVFASAEYEAMSIDDNNGGGLTAMVSWKNDAETFGLLGAISTLETVGRAHKGENYWTDAGWSGAGIAEFNQDRTRDAYDITAQLAPTDQLTMGLHYFNVTLDASNTNQNFLLHPDGNRDGDMGGLRTTTSPTNDCDSTTSTCYDGIQTKGVATRVQMFDDSNTRDAEMTTEVINFDVAFEGDGYTLSGAIGQTEADGGNGGSANGQWGLTPDAFEASADTANFDFTQDEKIQLRPNTRDFADPTWQTYIGGNIRELKWTDEETYAQADLDLDVDWGPITQIETGVKVRSHEFTNDQTDYALNDGLVGTFTKERFYDGKIDHSGAGLTSDSPTDLARVDGKAYKDWLEGNVGAANWSELSYAKVEEDITALYGQANFEGESYRGNFGLRYVETDVTGTHIDPLAYAEALARGDGSEDSVRQTSKVKGDYSDWLPSFNLAIDVSEDVIVRASAARVMSRPGYTSLYPSFSTFNTDTNQLSRGSVDLDPFRATQMDLGVEWYFNEDSLASATMFSKDIASFIGQKTESIVVNGDTYTLTTPDQGAGGTIEGIELQYQQNFGNFGVLANYTYADGSGKDSAGNSVDLPGNSQNTYNLTGFYENDIIAARLAYTYRSDYIAPSTGIGGNVSYDEQAFLDGSITWHVNDNIDLSLEGTNLLEEETYQRFSSGFDSVRVATQNGAHYFIKASYRM